MARKQPVVVDIPLELETPAESRSFFPKIPTRSNQSVRKSETAPDLQNVNSTLNCDMATLTLFDQNHERVSFSFLSQRKDLPELHKLLQNAKQTYLIGRRRRLQEPELTIRGACIPATQVLDAVSESTDCATSRLDEENDFPLPAVLPQRSPKSEPKRRADRRLGHRLVLPRLVDDQRAYAFRKLPPIRPASMNITGNGLGDKTKSNLHLLLSRNNAVTNSPIPKASVKLEPEQTAAPRTSNDYIKISQPISSPSPIKHGFNDDLPFSIRNNTPCSTVFANETHRNAAIDFE